MNFRKKCLKNYYYLKKANYYSHFTLPFTPQPKKKGGVMNGLTG